MEGTAYEVSLFPPFLCGEIVEYHIINFFIRDFGDVKAAADSNWKQVYRNSFREAENRKRARSGCNDASSHVKSE